MRAGAFCFFLALIGSAPPRWIPGVGGSRARRGTADPAAPPLLRPRAGREHFGQGTLLDPHQPRYRLPAVEVVPARRVFRWRGRGVNMVRYLHRRFKVAKQRGQFRLRITPSRALLRGPSTSRCEVVFIH